MKFNLPPNFQWLGMQFYDLRGDLFEYSVLSRILRPLLDVTKTSTDWKLQNWKACGQSFRGYQIQSDRRDCKASSVNFTVMICIVFLLPEDLDLARFAANTSSP